MRSLLSLLVLVLVTSCAYPVIPASRVGHTIEEHAKLKAKADSGDLDAQFDYGWSYCCGNDALYDSRVATQYMCSAAKQEHGKAQYTIAGLYRSKLFALPGHEAAVKRLPANDVVALAWYIVATNTGYPGAKDGREYFRDLSFEEVVAAIDMSRKYPDIPCEVQN